MHERAPRDWRRRSWPAAAPGGSAASTRRRSPVGTRAIIDRQLEVLRAVARRSSWSAATTPAWSARGLTRGARRDPGMRGRSAASTRRSCTRRATARSWSPATCRFCRARFPRTPGGDRRCRPRDSRRARAGTNRCAPFTPAPALPDIRARIARGALAGREAARRACASPSSAPTCWRWTERLFVNVNTPHDYERAKGLIELKPEPTEDRITTDATAVTDGPTTDS